MRLAARWGLRGLAPLARGGTGAALFANDRVVLKLALPGQAVRAEADALAGFDGDGTARLLDHDAAEGALLIERLSPGTPLTTLPDDAATRIAGLLMARLRRPVPQGALLADAHGWGRILLRTGPALPRADLHRAAALFRDLAAAAPAPVLLHGDLHHGNILADGRGWRAIDPHGARGDPAFEAACLLRNPPGAAAVARNAARRTAILAETAGLDPQRIAGWGYAGAVVAACWALEDGEDPAPWQVAIEALRPYAP